MARASLLGGPWDKCRFRGLCQESPTASPPMDQLHCTTGQVVNQVRYLVTVLCLRSTWAPVQWVRALWIRVPCVYLVEDLGRGRPLRGAPPTRAPIVGAVGGGKAVGRTPGPGMSVEETREGRLLPRDITATHRMKKVSFAPCSSFIKMKGITKYFWCVKQTSGDIAFPFWWCEHYFMVWYCNTVNEYECEI